MVQFKSFEPDIKYWQVEHSVIQYKSFEPDMKYWQIEHTRRFHPKVLNRTSWTYRVIPSKFWTRHEEQTSWIYRVITSKSFVPDIKYWQVEHTGWFNIKVLNQTWSTDKLNIQGDSIQKFWTRHEVLTSWTYRVIHSKSFEPDMKYWQIEHTGRFNPKLLNQTWSTDKLHIHSDSTNLSIPYKWVIFPGT